MHDKWVFKNGLEWESKERGGRQRQRKAEKRERERIRVMQERYRKKQCNTKIEN